MGAGRLERRLAAILAADVAGYSRLMEADESGTFARLKLLRADLVEPILAQHGGRLVDLKGDGAIVEFQSAVDAVEAAVAVQKAMLAQEPDLEEVRRIRFRIGINLGDVIVDSGTIYGDGVNVAARIESLCEPGGVWLLRNVYHQVKGKLDLSFAPTGRHQVKNISEAVETFRVSLDGSAPARMVKPSRHAWHRRALVAAAALFALVFAGGVWRLWPAGPPPEKAAIAVLPFDNYGGDEATGRLADGITEDVITDLARFRDLDVIARNSTEAYKGKPVDVRQVGKELGVAYVLEGSIQRTDDRVRLNAQLIDVRNGAHVWANRWDRPTGDVFAAQDELADQMANRIGGYGSVAESDRAAAKRKRPDDLSAYELYLLGIEHKHRLDIGNVKEAQELFDQAIGKDPKLARAYVGRAWTHLILLTYGPPYDFLANAQAAEADARAAIALDPQDAEAHAVLAEAALSLGQYDHSTAEYERALQLNPSSADVAAFACMLMYLGQAERAATLADRALQLNPSYPAFYPYYLGPAYFLARRPGDAVRILASVPAEQRSPFIATALAGSYAMLGQQEQAAKAVAEVRAGDPTSSIERSLATSWQFSGEQERRLFDEALGRAGLPRCAPASDLAAVDPKSRLPECEAERAKLSATRS